MASGALAILILRCDSGISNCRLEEIDKIDTNSREKLPMYKMHHPKADIDRLHVKRKGGGRGLLQIKLYAKQRSSMLQNICTHNIKNTSLKIIAWRRRKAGAEKN
jgi:hypothetical protein